MPSNRKLLFSFFLYITVLVSVITAGCGGGGSGSGTNGGTTGGGTDSQSLLIASIETLFASFDGSDPAAENQQMLAFMQQQPLFVDSGLSEDGGVWGRFADGTNLVIANNISRTETRSRVANGTHRSPASRLGGLPSTDNVVIATSLGSFWATANETVSDMFVAQNFAPVPDGGSVEALKAINNIGAMYLTAHGVSAPIHAGSPPTYIVWTSTKRAAPAEGMPDPYAAELRDGTLTYFMGIVATGDESSVVRTVETHYGFTEKFVAKYWNGKFNESSVVFMNSCGSANLRALTFEFAVLQAGASVYFGWTDTMLIRDGIVSAAYMFDRLLGANTFEPEVPSQRAFPYAAVYAEMTDHKRSYGTENYDSTTNPKTGITAKLQPLTLGGDFQQLAPSIESLAVDEQNDDLTIAGSFGTPKGDVYMNNNPMMVKSWSANRIVCALDRTGGDSSGGVSVRAAKPRMLSNTVQLTEWTGTIKTTQDGKGSLLQVMEFNVHFRADVHTRRIAPHQDPLFFLANYLQGRNTSGTFAVSGSYTSPDGLFFEEWTGSGAIPSYIKPPEGTTGPVVSYVIVEGSFNEDRKWGLALNAAGRGGKRIHTVIKDVQGAVVVNKTEDTDAVWLSLGDMNGDVFVATASTGWDIPGGSKSVQVSPDESLTIEWSAMSAKNPPKAEDARGR